MSLSQSNFTYQTHLNIKPDVPDPTNSKIICIKYTIMNNDKPPTWNTLNLTLVYPINGTNANQPTFGSRFAFDEGLCLPALGVTSEYLLYQNCPPVGSPELPALGVFRTASLGIVSTC